MSRIGAMDEDCYDLAVVGGGINGCGIARDAAGRGLKVLLVEKGDIAGATSSASTKLIHGGLRYLEHFEFRLVRESLRERERLLKAAPHIIRPMRFILPHLRGMRPSWMIRFGLLLYDHIGGREMLPPTRTLKLADDAAGDPLLPIPKLAYEYSDCWADDARLVVLNAIDAAERGAKVRVRSKCSATRKGNGLWRLELRGAGAAAKETAAARVLVNATGPWSSLFRESTAGGAETEAGGGWANRKNLSLRMVQGSHIVVPKMFSHDRAYILQHSDRRVVFVIPYENDFTLVGTTDREYHGSVDDVAISGEETDYLLGVLRANFRSCPEKKDIVWSFSGVRPLYGDCSENTASVTRDYELKLEGRPPLLSVFGGKLTTYRKLAEEAMARLRAFFPGMRSDWTGDSTLPGGDMPVDGVPDLAREIADSCAGLAQQTALRLARNYGTRALQMLDGVRKTADMGECFGADLHELETNHLVMREFALEAEDILWRRSKLGLRFTGAQKTRLGQWLISRTGSLICRNVG